jgi:hypothetical protein
MNDSNLSKVESNHPFDIHVVGLGMVGVAQITREAEQAIQNSNHVFFVDPGFGIEDYLRSISSATVTNLLGCYKEGEDRNKAYERMASYVIKAALEDSPVCFATYGHPFVLVHPTNLIKKASELLGLRIDILPGISTFDTVLIDLAFDPGTSGLQMFEATDLLIRDRPLQSDVPCLLWQVSSVETGLFTRSLPSSRRFERLQQHLLKFYPAEHIVTSILSSNFPLLGAIKESFPLKDLPNSLGNGHQSGTLFIPPVHKRPIKNFDLSYETYDIDHLASISMPK